MLKTISIFGATAIELILLACCAGLEPKPETVQFMPGKTASTTAMPAHETIERHALAALDYLESTRSEMGLDVILAMHVYAEQTGSTRAMEVANKRLVGIRQSEKDRYGILLNVTKASLPVDTLEAAVASSTSPNPADTLNDDRIQHCLDQVISCDFSQECVEYVELHDRWGYVLTHQAVTLAFSHWLNCPLPIDMLSRRRSIGVNLLAAMHADPVASELALERLAMLGVLGYSHEIRPEWVQTLLASQKPNGCFSVSEGEQCHSHSTGLALWVLAYVRRDYGL